MLDHTLFKRLLASGNDSSDRMALAWPRSATTQAARLVWLGAAEVRPKGRC
jgi:hypothetical protein